MCHQIAMISVQGPSGFSLIAEDQCFFAGRVVAYYPSSKNCVDSYWEGRDILQNDQVVKKMEQ